MPSVTLRQPLSWSECEQIRIWRNAPDVFPMLRTGYKTEDEQAMFYRTHIAPKCWQRTFWRPEHWYYAIDADQRFAGIGGLTHLQKRKGEAEISLVLGPHARGRGIGAQAVGALLAEAWRLGLTSVIGECYPQSPAYVFWMKEIRRVKTGTVTYAGSGPDRTLLWAWGKP